MQYTEKELSKLIEDVEKEFTTHLAKAEEDFKSSKLAKSEAESEAQVDGTESLAKAEDEKPDSAEDKEEPKSEEKPAEEAPAAEAPAKEEAAPEAPAADEAKAAAPAEGGHGYDDEDLEHMRQMYSSMSKEELIAHHDAVKQCLDGMAAQSAEAAPAAEAPAEEAAPAPMAKSEESAVEKTEAPVEVELLKSEIEAEKAKSADLKKNLDAVSEFLGKLLTKKAAPTGKAITSLDVITKSDNTQEEKPLTKSEVTAILAKKAAEPTLTKSDRDLINAFYLNGASINSISHLLKSSGI